MRAGAHVSIYSMMSVPTDEPTDAQRDREHKQRREQHRQPPARLGRKLLVPLVVTGAAAAASILQNMPFLYTRVTWQK